MPEECHLFSNDVMHRDFFECNPTNTGHHKYPKFETLSYDDECHHREINNFLGKEDSEKYVVFYTRHTNISNKSKNKIIGYFKVGELYKNGRGFYSQKSVLLPKCECIELNYSARGVPRSWGNSKIKYDIDGILDALINKPDIDITQKYKKETDTIMNRYLNSASGRREIIDVCEKCEVKTQCYHWGKKPKQSREEILNDLYGSTKVC